jgi:hypothetical protein
LDLQQILACCVIGWPGYAALAMAEGAVVLRAPTAETPLLLPSDKDPEAAHTSHQRTVGVWRFVALAFFCVSGGPFGIEVAIGAGEQHVCGRDHSRARTQPGPF